MTKEEIKVLDRVSKDIYGCKYSELDFEKQDEIYVIAEENGLM